MNARSRPDGQIGAAESISAANLKLPSSLPAAPDWAPWTTEEVWRLHHDLQWHVLPVDSHKRPLVRWVNGSVNLREQRASDELLVTWLEWAPAGWAVTCGGPSRLVVLDVEGAGMLDAGLGGQRIAECLARLPAHCLRPTPSGGTHAFFQVMDGDLPSASGSRLLKGSAGSDNEGALLAEYRTYGHYVVVLGPRRGSLAEDFRPTAITGAELARIFDDLRGGPVATSIRRRPSVAARAHGERQTEHTARVLAQLPGGSPCGRVRDRTDQALKRMSEDELTPAILAPVLMLVRLGVSGHVGVRPALEELHEAFISRVAVRGNRAGGLPAAEDQWARSLDGAVRKVVKPGHPLRSHAVCECWLTTWRRAQTLAPAELRSKSGQQRTTDSDVLDYLFRAALRKRSRRVRESQRQIARHADRGLKPVSRSLGRLEEQGWIGRQDNSVGPDTIELRIPASEETTTEKPSGVPEVGEVVVSSLAPSRADTHGLFGPQGVGAGAAQTYALLPEYRLQLGGGWLTQTGHRDDGRDRTSWDLSHPLPAPPGGGLTVAQLAERGRRHVTTVRGHLRRLGARDLAFRDPQGRWWRNRVDPVAVAVEDEIRDTSAEKQERFDRERRAWLEPQVAAEHVELVPDGRSVIYIDARTGEVMWRDLNPLAAGRASAHTAQMPTEEEQ